MFRDYIRKINPGFIFSAIGLLLLIAVHTILITKTFTVDNEGNIRTAVAGYGDIPLHLTQITKFAYSSFNLNEPIYFGAKLNYPFLLNLFCAKIISITSNLQFSVLAPVIILEIANIAITFLFFKKFIKNYFLSMLGVLVFFLGAGLGGFSLIQDAISSKVSIFQFITNITETSTSTITKWDGVFPVQNIDYGAPLSLAFLHQRTFFLGFFLFLSVIFFISKLNPKTSSKQIVFFAILFGILPLSHVHSFIAAAISVFSYFIAILIYRNYKYIKKFITFCVISLLISAPQLIFLLNSKNVFSDSAEFLQFRLGWMVYPTIGSATFPENSNPTILSLSYLNFLWVNFGILLPVFLIASIWIVKNVRSGNKDFFFPFWIGLSALLTFIIVQTVKLQPWDYDNNKLLVFFHFFAALTTFLFFYKTYKKSLAFVIILTLYLILSLTSGILDQIPRLNTSNDKLHIIFSKNAQEVALYIRANIKDSETIITGSGHLNPVSSLAGRQVLVGYPGWLWTRGISYSQRLKDLEDFYESPSKEDKILKEFNAKYVLIDNQTRHEFEVDEESFDTNFQKIFKKGEYVLYKLKN